MSFVNLFIHSLHINIIVLSMTLLLWQKSNQIQPKNNLHLTYQNTNSNKLAHLPEDMLIQNEFFLYRQM